MPRGDASGARCAGALLCTMQSAWGHQKDHGWAPIHSVLDLLGARNWVYTVPAVTGADRAGHCFSHWVSWRGPQVLWSIRQRHFLQLSNLDSTSRYSPFHKYTPNAFCFFQRMPRTDKFTVTDRKSVV